MKRISLLLVTCALGMMPLARGQDAATEERLNKLSGRIEDLIAAQESMRKQLSDLSREIESVREVASKPPGNWASQEDANRLKKAIEEVDRKREADADKVQKELGRIREAVLKSATLPPPAPPVSTKKTSKKENKDDSAPASSGDATAPANDKVFPYVVQKGDSLSVIVQAYREKNIKVTVDQILKANPGLDEKKLKVGQKIYIPAPQ
jgi:LysM repeat protein